MSLTLAPALGNMSFPVGLLYPTMILQFLLLIVFHFVTLSFLTIFIYLFYSLNKKYGGFMDDLDVICQDMVSRMILGKQCLEEL